LPVIHATIRIQPSPATISSGWLKPIFLSGQKFQPMPSPSTSAIASRNQPLLFSPDSPSQIGRL
jgi:hypothetical protein